MELTEPTLPNLLGGIDKAIAPGVGFGTLIGMTRQSTRLLQEDPDEQVPLAEMIQITNSRLVRIWSALNRPSKPIDVLCCCNRMNHTEYSTPPPGLIIFAPHDDQGRLPDDLDDRSAGSDHTQSSDGHQPEWSSAATKQTT